jgi:hypothetical protein
LGALDDALIVTLSCAHRDRLCEQIAPVQVSLIGYPADGADETARRLIPQGTRAARGSAAGGSAVGNAPRLRRFRSMCGAEEPG